MASVKPIPDGYNTVSTYLIVKNSVEALEFYRKAFGAEPGVRMPTPDGKSTMHAEMKIGNSTVMLTDENPQWGAQAPETLGGSPSSLHIYVTDADALFKKATQAGCEVIYPINDTFWGDRYGKVKDPFGHQWGIATHKEDVPPEEMGRRAAEWFKNMKDQPCE
jgi:PhnB protein